MSIRSPVGKHYSLVHSFTFSLREATLTMPCACPKDKPLGLSKKRIINRSVKPRMYKFPTCTPVCTSFRLVHRKANFTNQKKQTFPDQLNPRMYNFPTCTPTDKLHQPKKQINHKFPRNLYHTLTKIPFFSNRQRIVPVQKTNQLNISPLRLPIHFPFTPPTLPLLSWRSSRSVVGV